MENKLEVINNNENKTNNTNKKVLTKQFKKGIKNLLIIIIAVSVICILLVSFLKTIFKIETADTKDNKTAKKWESVANSTSSSISSRGGTVVQKAIECHEYLREHGFKYDDEGISKTIPDFLEDSRKIVDCSAFVSLVLYQAGLDSFKGGQESNFKSNPHELKEVSEDDIQPGDILVYNSHVEIAAKVENNKVTLVYNCGVQDAIDAKGTDEYPETSSPHNESYTAILRVP